MAINLNKNKYLLLSVYVYAIITALSSIFLTIEYFHRGSLNSFLGGTYIDWDIIVFDSNYATAAWGLLGSILVLSLFDRINKQNAVFYTCFYIIAFLYINILRERIGHGDVWDYVKAAVNIYLKQPFHARYIYPPLWATLLRLFMPLGSAFIARLCVFTGYLAIICFFPLLCIVLRKYGFSKLLSVLSAFIILIVNVPALRTLVYVQVNFIVMDLIMLCLIFYRKNIFVSALCLSLAIHIKITPIILILPFLINKDIKWITYFLASTVAIVIITSSISGFEYYNSFITNLTNSASTPALDFRNNSIDSIVYNTIRFYPALSFINPKYFVYFCKLIFLISGIFLFIKQIKSKLFYENDKKEAIIYNGVTILLFLMIILPPLLWEHHHVFIILPFLVMITRLSNIKELFFYLSAYFLIFLMPTFDLYPLSYHRLAGIILCYILFFKFMKNTGKQSDWFTKLNKKCDDIGNIL